MLLSTSDPLEFFVCWTQHEQRPGGCWDPASNGLSSSLLGWLRFTGIYWTTEDQPVIWEPNSTWETKTHPAVNHLEEAGFKI